MYSKINILHTIPIHYIIFILFHSVLWYFLLIDISFIYIYIKQRLNVPNQQKFKFAINKNIQELFKTYLRFREEFLIFKNHGKHYIYQIQWNIYKIVFNQCILKSLILVFLLCISLLFQSKI